MLLTIFLPSKLLLMNILNRLLTATVGKKNITLITNNQSDDNYEKVGYSCQLCGRRCDFIIF